MINFKNIALSIMAVFSCSSCMKSPSTAIEKGPEVACEDLDNALNKVSFGSIYAIKKCEYASTDSSTRLDVLPPEVTEQYSVMITNKEETDQTIELEILERLREKINGQFKLSEKIGKVSITKKNPVSQEILNQTSQTLRSFSEFKTAAANSAMCALKESGTKSFNNLEVKNIFVDVPPAVRAQKNEKCGGLTNCAAPLQAVQLKFDRWLTGPDGKELKVTNYITSSPDVPFFASRLSICAQYTYPIEGRPILVTTCDDVKDFSFGQDDNTASCPVIQ